jgi:cytoskeletal protein CcmA (bactofilin family)
MARSSLLSKSDLVNMNTQIDKMNAELTNLTLMLEKLLTNARALSNLEPVLEDLPPLGDEITSAPVLEELPPLDDEITATKAKPSKQELNFEHYDVLNIDSGAGTVAASEKTSTESLQSNENLTTQYLPGYIPTLTRASFPMKVVGDVFYVGDGVTSVVGNAEIPSGTIVDATLVVKGNFSSGKNCRLLRDVKALKDIVLGPNTVVEGNLVAGGKVTLGSNCIVHGTIESEGDIEIGENAVIEGILCSKSSIIAGQFTRVLRSVYAARGLST